jgi:hypothetical protein
MGDHMSMFAQRSGLTQAAASARQAKSSGQLTKIVTFIVPCSFVASIFSMSGTFAAGEQLFFVYWALSVPITILLLAWVGFHDPDRGRYVQLPKECIRQILQKFGEAGPKAQGAGEPKVGRRWLSCRRNTHETYNCN